MSNPQYPAGTDFAPFSRNGRESRLRCLAMKIRALSALAGFVAGLAPCAAADTIWNLNAAFSYNALSNTATGTFELDPGLNLVTWDITVTGSNVAGDDVYTAGDSIDVFPDLTHLDFYDGGANQYINLYFQSALTTAGGTINLLYGNGGLDDNATIVCAGCGTLDSGAVSTASTPEPSSIWLFGAGVLMLGLVWLRR